MSTGALIFAAKNNNSVGDADMLSYSNNTFSGGFILDGTLDSMGNKVGNARNMSI